MVKNFMLSGWGVTVLTLVYLYMIDLFAEYIISREVASEIQIVSTLGVLVYTYYLLKLIYNFIQNNLKQKQND
jgi:hypothetical protein